MICSICQAPVPGNIPMCFSRGRVQLTLCTLPSTMHWGFSVNNPWSFFNICIISNTVPTSRAVLQWRQRRPAAGTAACGIQGAPPTGWSLHAAFALHGSCKPGVASCARGVCSFLQVCCAAESSAKGNRPRIQVGCSRSCSQRGAARRCCALVSL